MRVFGCLLRKNAASRTEGKGVFGQTVTEIIEIGARGGRTKQITFKYELPEGYCSNDFPKLVFVPKKTKITKNDAILTGRFITANDYKHALANGNIQAPKPYFPEIDMFCDELGELDSVTRFFIGTATGICVDFGPSTAIMMFDVMYKALMGNPVEEHTMIITPKDVVRAALPFGLAGGASFVASDSVLRPALKLLTTSASAALSRIDPILLLPIPNAPVSVTTDGSDGHYNFTYLSDADIDALGEEQEKNA